MRKQHHDLTTGQWTYPRTRRGQRSHTVDVVQWNNEVLTEDCFWSWAGGALDNMTLEKMHFTLALWRLNHWPEGRERRSRSCQRYASA